MEIKGLQWIHLTFSYCKQMDMECSLSENNSKKQSATQVCIRLFQLYYHILFTHSIWPSYSYTQYCWLSIARFGCYHHSGSHLFKHWIFHQSVRHIMAISNSCFNVQMHANSQLQDIWYNSLEYIISMVAADTMFIVLHVLRSPPPVCQIC